MDVRKSHSHHQILGEIETILISCLGALTPFPGDPLFWALLVGWLAVSLVRQRPWLREIYCPLSVLAILGWIILSTLWSIEIGYTVRALAQIVILTTFALLVAVGRSVSDILRVGARAFILILAASWVFAIVAPGSAFATEDHAGAMQGLFVQKNEFGFVSAMALCTTGAYALVTRRSGGRPRVEALLGVTLSMVSIIASTSKTALSVAITLLAIGVALPALARARKPVTVTLMGWSMMLTTVIAVLVSNYESILVLLGRNATLTGRTRIWEIVISAISSRPLTGYGWSALWKEGSSFTKQLWAENYHIPFWHAHNGYLDVTAQIGVVGLVLLLGFMLRLLWGASLPYLQDGLAANGWPIALVVVLLVYNATEVVFFWSLTWVLLVAAAASLGRERSERKCMSPMLAAS